MVGRGKNGEDSVKASIDDMIKDIEAANGPITGVATLAQALKGVMRQGRNWEGLPNEAKELLEQAATLLARILNGDAADPSHWNGAAACLRLRVLSLASGGNAAEAKAAAQSVEAEINQVARRIHTMAPAREPAA